ncbi:MAG: flagellar hook-basal body protein [Turicibacter sp.]
MSLMMQIGKSGAKAYQNQVNVGAHNISNSNTTAFKKNYADLKDLAYNQQNLPLMNNEVNAQQYYQGSGVRSDSVYENFTQGALISTGVSSNYAVSGSGYFGVLDKATNQVVLTRDGAFGYNETGELVDAYGNKVMTKTLINDLGQETKVPMLYQPNLKANMMKNTQGYYAVAPGNLISEATNPQGFGDVSQGFLEASNVDMAEEMTNLMIAQRAYSMSIKTIQTADETAQVINNLR